MTHSRIKKAIKELDKEYLFWGNIPETLEKHNIFDIKEVKEVLDGLEIENPKLRSFVYKQMKLNPTNPKDNSKKLLRNYYKTGWRTEDW